MKDNNSQLSQTVLMIKDKVAVIVSNQPPEDKKKSDETPMITTDRHNQLIRNDS